ncbi:MAG: FG-GAP-like repeat-containing protein, partial [candidate division WOR-3 bacterium]
FVISSASIADVDLDGQLEILIGSYDRKVYCLRGSDGTQKWATTPFPAYVHAPGALADIDGDGKFEYLVSQINFVMGEPDTLFCLNAENGTRLWKIGFGQWGISGPFAGDIDNDGCIEVIAGTEYPDGAGYHLFALDDPGNTSGCGTLYENTEEGPGKKDLDFRPIGQGLYLFLPEDSQISIILYDPSGRPVQILYDGFLSQGGHTFIVGTETRGVYLAVLEYPGGTETLKIVR